MRGISANIAGALGAARSGAAGAIPIQLNIAPAMQQLKSLRNQIAAVKHARPIPIALNIAPAVSAASRIRSIVNALPHIKRTITYTYRIVGSRPNPPNLNRTITYRYRTVGSRPAHSGMHETLKEDTLIAAHKGERVDIGPDTGHTAVVSNERTHSARIGSESSNRSVILNATFISQLDGREVARNQRRYAFDNMSGAM
jgi:hypothetical protein